MDAKAHQRHHLKEIPCVLRVRADVSAFLIVCGLSRTCSSKCMLMRVDMFQLLVFESPCFFAPCARGNCIVSSFDYFVDGMFVVVLVSSNG